MLSSFFLSIGGAAISKILSIKVTKADIAIGGVSRGIVAVYNQSGTGKYLFRQPVNFEELSTVIKNIYPKLSNIILKIIKIFL